MNILNKVTAQSLKKNKTRTIVTVIGIILSAAMMTAVTTLISSLRESALEAQRDRDGDWYGYIDEADESLYNEMESDPEIVDIKAYGILGYAVAEDSTNEAKPYLYVLSANGRFFDSMPVKLISGRLPMSENELLLPAHLKSNGDVSYETGDTVILPIGERQVYDGETAYSLCQFNPYTQDEVFTARSERSFTVVGFYERPDFEEYSAPGYTVLTYSDKPQSETACRIYFKTRSAGNVYAILNKYGDGLMYNDNSDLLMFMGESSHSAFYTMLYGLAAVLICIIMAGSISLIYNSFAISVSERTRQIGLLSSVGATKKQIRGSIIYEALLLSSVGIPLGIGSGILGIGVTLAAVGGIIKNMFFAGEKFSLHVSLPAVVAAAVISLVTVLISAWIPAKRASRITAIEAIRQSGDITVKKSLSRPAPITYRLFGLEGLLAKKQFKRAKKRYRATVISLFMSVLLFVAAGSFSEYLSGSVGDVYGSEFDVSYYNPYAEYPSTDAEKLYSAMEGIEGVEEGTLVYSCGYTKTSVDAALLNDKAKRKFAADNSVAEMYVNICEVDDGDFLDYLSDLGVDSKAYFDAAAPLVAVINSMFYIDYDNEKYQKIKVFSSAPESLTLTDMSLDNEDGEDEAAAPVTVSVGVLTEAHPYGAAQEGSGLMVLMARSVAEQVLPRNRHLSASIFIKASDHLAVSERLSAIQDSLAIGGNVRDAASQEERSRDIITVINVFTIGFTVLISLIAAANVFNTISTNIRLRRREFAMLKSVGMTAKGFRRMMNYECLLYGLKSLLYSIPVSVVVTWFIYLSVNSALGQSFFIPLRPLLIAVAGVFVIVFISMFYSMSKIKNDNPIEALKNENL